MDYQLDLLDSIKEILGLDDASPMLEWILKDAIQAVLDYCHLSVLPEALKTFVVLLVVRKFNAENSGNIASIKRGDTSISYNEPLSTSEFTPLEISRLNAYRRFIMR